MIERDLLIQSYGVIEPLRITYATNEQTIRFWLKDYTLTNNHSAKVYNLTPDGHHYQQNATIDLTQNTITFTPDAGFFSVGENEMQLAISTSAYSTYSFIIPVTCEKNIMADNDPEEATEAMAIVAQAQAAAEVYETATLAVRDNLTVIQNAPTYAQTCQSAVDTVNGYGARITTLENVNASSRLTALETAKGTTDISSISDGTLTGAIKDIATPKTSQLTGPYVDSGSIKYIIIGNIMIFSAWIKVKQDIITSVGGIYIDSFQYTASADSVFIVENAGGTSRTTTRWGRMATGHKYFYIYGQYAVDTFYSFSGIVSVTHT